EEMTAPVRLRIGLAAAVVLTVGTACSLKRPDTPQVRMVEPQLEEPAKQDASATNAMAVRLLDTQARGHIGRRLLRQQPGGELVEDPIWRWSSAPDRYLDTALRQEITSRSDVRLVDTATSASLAVTLVAWNLESAGETKLVGAIELQLTAADRTV